MGRPDPAESADAALPRQVPEPPDHATSGPEIDEEVIAFAHQCFELARNGETEELARLVDAGLPVELTNDRGDTLLILAAYHRHDATVAALIQRGAELNRANDRGQTALASAVFRQHEPTVRLLLGAGADPEAGRQSAVVTAQVFGLGEMRELLGQ